MKQREFQFILKNCTEVVESRLSKALKSLSAKEKIAIMIQIAEKAEQLKESTSSTTENREKTTITETEIDTPIQEKKIISDEDFLKIMSLVEEIEKERDKIKKLNEKNLSGDKK